ETASKRGHNYVTVFIDLDRKQKPVIFVTPGKGKGCLVVDAKEVVHMVPSMETGD
ncbi:ISL3 family transposase, partial [Patescibacteria group bacterium]